MLASFLFVLVYFCCLFFELLLCDPLVGIVLSCSKHCFIVNKITLKYFQNKCQGHWWLSK